MTEEKKPMKVTIEVSSNKSTLQMIVIHGEQKENETKFEFIQRVQEHMIEMI